MTICYLGDYNKNYTRTRVIIKGLEQAGANIIHCHEESGGLKMYKKLWKKHRMLRGKYDVLFIGLGNARFMPTFARLITRKPVVWEPLYSMYDNWVIERKYFGPHSLKAYKLWLVDWLGCKLAKLIILDTNNHAEYFMKTFSLPRKKMGHVSVGADPETFFPRERTKTGVFEVEFHGKYIPLQGTEVIVRAAKILENENIHFTMIGAGQYEKRTKNLAEKLGLENITFLPFMSQEEIVNYIKNADICMGIIGDTPRVVRSIPNKAWEVAAMARPFINVNSESLREIFTPGVDAIGIKQGDEKDLANSILKLKNSGRAKELGEAAYQTYLKAGIPKVIGTNLINILKKRFLKLNSL